MSANKDRESLESSLLTALKPLHVKNALPESMYPQELREAMFKARMKKNPKFRMGLLEMQGRKDCPRCHGTDACCTRCRGFGSIPHGDAR